MNTAATFAQFVSTNPPAAFPVSSSWNSANDVLTCTPSSPFPANAFINWFVSGTDANGMPVFGQGIFSTGSATNSEPTGYGTNQITTFSVGKLYSFSQGPSGPPVPASFAPFIFNGNTVLASNRTATAITLTLPNSAVSNANQNPVEKEIYSVFYFNTSSNALESTFPQGAYNFTVNATASNQTVSVTLPASMAQPNAPQITNYAAAQAVDASKPFTLEWQPFAGGTTSDFIQVTIGNWTSPQYGTPGALDGTATSVTILPGVLAANSNYTAEVGFERGVWTTNSAYATGAYRATVTAFTLQTVSGVTAPPPVVSNPGWTGNLFGFDVNTVPGQLLTVVYSADCSLPLQQWLPVTSTNSSGTRVHISDTNSLTMPTLFYRVRNGP